MAGLYFHVPFCKQLCFYCDFHFSLSLRFKPQMVEAMLRELEMRVGYLPDTQIDTIYFGGGTPSLLSIDDLERFLARSRALFHVAADAEITLEANPDDLHPAYLDGLRRLGINRLSIGIQSFHEDELRLMNRRHTAGQGEACVAAARLAGFENLTVDLIYGLPASTLETWRYSLLKALDMGLPHYACYHLGIEEKTAFAEFRRRGQIAELHEDASWQQYQLLCQEMQAAGLGHYEISNFGRPGRESRHNSAYWHGVPYLGIGPSAHSFDGKSRQWNIPHNQQYMNAVNQRGVYFEREQLSSSEQLNDYLLTQLRTAHGVRYAVLDAVHAKYAAQVRKAAERYRATDALWFRSDGFGLTEAGMFRSDAILTDLFQLDVSSE